MAHYTTRRPCLAHANTISHGFTTSLPAPAYDECGVRRSKSSLPVRMLRRLTNKREQPLDPDTIPVWTKRDQRRADKRERKRKEELDAYERKRILDDVSRLREASQHNHGDHSEQLQRPRKVKDKIRSTLRKARKPPVQTTSQLPSQQFEAEDHLNPPHIDDFSNKDELTNWFQPSDVEAHPRVPVMIHEDLPAELPADGCSSYPVYDGDLANEPFHDRLQINTPPPPVRSPSPCLSAIPRRGITISETTAGPSSRQMQCDYCHGAIKLTGYHYACNLCNDGDCLYCANCVDEGYTCRHQLVERTRNIKRHPTNPSHAERKSMPIEDLVSNGSVQSIELSSGSVKQKFPRLSTKDIERPSISTEPVALAISPVTTEDFLRDFESKRREQEVVFREKEVTLRERAAMLREREAWTAARERDNALVQQLQAAAMLQQRAEVGSQFSPVSRQNSCYDTVSRRSSFASHMDRAPSQSSCRTSSRPQRTASIVLHTDEVGRKPNVEFASSMAAMEASFAGIEMVNDGVRSHTNANKRKATTSSDRAPSSRTSSTGKGINQQQNSRPPSQRSNEDPDEDQDDGDSDSGSPKRQKSSVSSTEPQKIFACPFSKHDPVRYAEGNTDEINYRSCAGGLYRDISRVKQHLKRVHHRPDFYCRRCFEAFTTSEKLQQHSSSPKPCDAKECPYPERLDEAKQAKIHVKRPKMKPVELWFEIFDIIFPGQPRPESPYIEQPPVSETRPEVLDQFIRLLNRRLDAATQSEPWLISAPTREFFNAQIAQTLQEIRFQNAITPSVFVSPISPPMDYRSRPVSQTSRDSSVVPQFSTSLSPIGSQIGLRPALKVTTYGMRTSSENSATLSGSARSRRNSSFPRVPSHVREDSGYGRDGESWMSGDDVHVMGDQQMGNTEPSSATSTRSTKSVSFAPPPDRWTPFTDPHPKAPTLSDFAAQDWTSHDVLADEDPVSDNSTYYQRVMSSFEQRQKDQTQQRVDSAYGTLSSAHASCSSLHRPQQDEQQQQHFGSTQASCTEELMCVNPQLLYIGSPTRGHGFSADLEAYMNRDLGNDDYFSQ